MDRKPNTRKNFKKLQNAINILPYITIIERPIEFYYGKSAKITKQNRSLLEFNCILMNKKTYALRRELFFFDETRSPSEGDESDSYRFFFSVLRPRVSSFKKR